VKIIKSEPLSKYTTLNLGGPADYFVEVFSEKEMKEAVGYAEKKNLPYLVFGEGSNMLISDEGYRGMVIKNSIREINSKDSVVTASSGTKLKELVHFAVEKGLSGMEKLAGIPGTVGGAVYGNAGGYGVAISDNLIRVKVFDGKKIYWIDKKDCNFDYRESIFKKNKLLILGAKFKLEKSSYEKVKNLAAETIADRMKKYDFRIKSAGSFFKNVLASGLSVDQLKMIPKDKIIYGKIPAGYFLEEVGAKGAKRGGIKILESHANFIINDNNGTAEDFYKLAMEYKNKVKEKFGIVLEPEVQLIGLFKKIAILGYGLEGQDAEKYFKKQRAEITVLDKKFDKNYLENLSSFDLIIRSPGVYRFLPELVEAEKAGIEISSAIKIFFENCQAKIIGVTGTKGKGTTATLIYEILKKAGKDVYLAGNIGKPYLELLPIIHNSSYVILELSSFQLIDLNKSPQIAAVLNITTDHLDWHKNREEYVNAKKNIVSHQTTSDWAVINKQYETPKSFANETKGQVVFFSKNELEEKYKKNLLLRGEHNLENIAAAVAVAKILKIEDEDILEILSSFKGLEHRLELVGEKAGITFYNDSFATGPQPTIAAIKSFTEPITLILGGYDKGLDYQELCQEISKRKNIEKIILIGDIREKLKKELEKNIFSGKIIDLKYSKMDKIVENAYKNISKGGVVLLSPAAASFDMFKDYKDRGNQFKKAASNL
jgi:UDP-N-acetylmuramoylalanine--D-glutamate ligase